MLIKNPAAIAVLKPQTPPAERGEADGGGADFETYLDDSAGEEHDSRYSGTDVPDPTAESDAGAVELKDGMASQENAEHRVEHGPDDPAFGQPPAPADADRASVFAPGTARDLPAPPPGQTRTESASTQIPAQAAHQPPAQAAAERVRAGPPGHVVAVAQPSDGPPEHEHQMRLAAVQATAPDNRAEPKPREAAGLSPASLAQAQQEGVAHGVRQSADVARAAVERLPDDGASKPRTPQQGNIPVAQAHSAAALQPTSPPVSSAAIASPFDMNLFASAEIDALPPAQSTRLDVETSWPLPSASAPGGHQGAVIRRIALQISEPVRRHGDGNYEIALSPEELGRVRISVRPVEGAVSLSIFAERPETLELMRRHIDALEAEFREQGFGEVNVNLSNAKNESGSQGADHALPSPDSSGIVPEDAPPSGPPAQLLRIVTSALDLRL